MITFLFGIFISTMTRAQEYHIALGMNFQHVSYAFTYTKEADYPYYYEQNGMFYDSKFAFGPSARVWYDHELGGRLNIIAGIEGTVGLVPGDGSLLNGFLIEVPVFGGVKYNLNDKYSLFSTLGVSYDGLISYNELKSVFANLEAGVEIEMDAYTLLLKARFGRLFYQHYSYDLPFAREEATGYKGNLFNLGFEIEF